VGGAKIAEEHGNYIINFNQATQADVLALVEEIKMRVYNKFGVELEPEVQIII
jgi:UDP-N-acetylmuramate dehydrogenase